MILASKSDSGEDEESLVTREMFLREMLSDPHGEGGEGEGGEGTGTTGEINKNAKVRRKKRNGTHYRTLDNRDSLPFLVKVSTPDPYTNNAEMKEMAKINTERERERSKKNKSSKKNGGGKNKNSKSNGSTKRRHNLIGMDGKDSIASSIFTRGDDGAMHRVVGEFALDKSTNCGDVIEVGDGTEYIVQKARCQYKYAGGKQFVMTRKILEVKEVKRVLVENEVKKLFEKDINDGDGDINGNSNGGLHLE